MDRATVNIPARRAYAELVRQFASGRVSNMAFEKRGCAIERKYGRDAGANEVEYAAWHLYDDFKEQRLNRQDREARRELRREMARWVLFLRTTLPAPKKPRWQGDHVRTALCLVGACCWLTGSVLLLVGPAKWGWMALACGMGCGLLAWTISWGIRLYFRMRPERLAKVEAAERCSMWPFESAAQLQLAASRCGYLGDLAGTNTAHASTT